MIGLGDRLFWSKHIVLLELERFDLRFYSIRSYRLSMVSLKESESLVSSILQVNCAQEYLVDTEVECSSTDEMVTR